MFFFLKRECTIEDNTCLSSLTLVFTHIDTWVAGCTYQYSLRWHFWPIGFLPPTHLHDVGVPANHKCYIHFLYRQKYHANMIEYRVARKKGYVHLATGLFLKAHLSMISSSLWVIRTKGAHRTCPHAKRAWINTIIGITHITAGNCKRTYTTQPFHPPSFTVHKDSWGGGYGKINERHSRPIHTEEISWCYRRENHKIVGHYPET